MPEPSTQSPATQSIVVQPAAPVAAVAVTPPTATSYVMLIGEWALALAAIGTVVALLYKLLTRDISRDVSDVSKRIGDVDHRTRGVATRVDALEHLRTADIERIVRVETAVTGIKETTARIEQTLDKNFDSLATSIREIRNVAPRGAA